MHLYRDMSARDLLQRRTTTRDGDTVFALLSFALLSLALEFLLLLPSLGSAPIPPLPTSLLSLPPRFFPPRFFAPRSFCASLLLPRVNTIPEQVWKDTPLTVAAKNGGLVVLDGIDRLAPSVLSVLQQICQVRLSICAADQCSHVTYVGARVNVV